MAYVEVRFVNTRSVSKATLGRLPDYLRYLKSLDSGAGDNISAAAIARALRFGDVQVRKDLGAVSGAGKPRVGYNTRELIANLEDALGLNNRRSAVLVGAGRLGRALLSYAGFQRYGLNIVAGFDTNPRAWGQDEVSGKMIYAMDKLDDLCRRLSVHMGIITVPAPVAQCVCDELVGAGCRAIWNFAPTHIRAPGNILIKNENMASSLALISHHLRRNLEEEA